MMIPKRIQQTVWALALASAVLLGACAEKQRLGILKTAYDAYDAGMRIAAEMRAKGEITSDQWTAIANIGDRYVAAYKVAVEAYWQWDAVRDRKSEQIYLQALQAFQIVYAEFVTQIRELKNGQEQDSNDGNSVETSGAVDGNNVEKLRQRRSDDWRSKEIGVGDEVSGSIP